jgi:hypothetical protein
MRPGLGFFQGFKNNIFKIRGSRFQIQTFDLSPEVLDINQKPEENKIHPLGQKQRVQKPVAVSSGRENSLSSLKAQKFPGIKIIGTDQGLGNSKGNIGLFNLQFKEALLQKTDKEQRKKDKEITQADNKPEMEKHPQKGKKRQNQKYFLKNRNQPENSFPAY